MTHSKSVITGTKSLIINQNILMYLVDNLVFWVFFMHNADAPGQMHQLAFFLDNEEYFFPRCTQNYHFPACCSSKNLALNPNKVLQYLCLLM